MATDKAPAFQFYPKDFLTDERVVMMSNTEIGIYVRLLCFCWLEGTLPLETASLARMARLPLKQFTKLWEHSVVKTCFWVDDGRLRHKRLDGERDKQESYRRRQSDAATARWNKPRLSQPGNATAYAEGMPPVVPAQCSSSSSASASAEEEQEKSAEASSAPVFLTYPIVGPKGPAWSLTETQVSTWAKLFPGLNVEAECLKALAWLQANPQKRKTVTGMPKFLTAWLSRATDRGGSPTLAMVPPLGKFSSRMADMVIKARSGV